MLAPLADVLLLITRRIQFIPAQGVSLAVGCSDAAGQIQRATDQMQRQISELGRLEDYVVSLEADQRQIADSTDEAKLLSARACEQLDAGAERVNSAVTEFRSVHAVRRL